MRTKHFFLFAIACLTMFSACNEDKNTTLNEEKDTTTLLVNTLFLSFPSTVSWIERVDITTNATVTTSISPNSAAWCSVKTYEEFGYIEVSVEDNPMAEPRTAVIIVQAGALHEEITVTQAAGEAVLSISPTLIRPIANAGTCSINVTSNAAWTVEVEDAANNSWCTLTSVSGTGNGTVTVNVAKNFNARRYAIVVIKAGDLQLTDTILQHGGQIMEEGVTINGITWATRNVDGFGAFATFPNSSGKFYQFNRTIGYSSTDPVTPAWNTMPIYEGADWLPINDPCPEGWRIPTTEELANLLTSGSRWVNAEESGWSCAGVWYGTNATNSIAGNSSQAIFLPATGGRAGDEGESFYQYNYYWSSNQGWHWDEGRMLILGSGQDPNRIFINKQCAVPIRCVKE